MTNTVKEKNGELLSKRWAQALMDLVQEDENVSKDTVLNNLREIASTIDSSEELTSVINNPAISTEEKQIVLCKLFQDKLIPVVYNFIYVLNLRKRVNLINEIADAFEKKLEEINNIAHVNITSAIELESKKKEEIKSKISSKLNKGVIVDWEVDSDIIAGLIFNIDETVVDNSIRHKLEDLSKNIIR